mmetsp:Transcript_8475/g.31368  ORF Transcript_8475/g.31368 Transcript_8475/m.31368 type:complete len:262 (+) Transcript_8475:510-1295(+)
MQSKNSSRRISMCATRGSTSWRGSSKNLKANFRRPNIILLPPHPHQKHPPLHTKTQMETSPRKSNSSITLSPQMEASTEDGIQKITSNSWPSGQSLPTNHSSMRLQSASPDKHPSQYNSISPGTNSTSHTRSKRRTQSNTGRNKRNNTESTCSNKERRRSSRNSTSRTSKSSNSNNSSAREKSNASSSGESKSNESSSSWSKKCSKNRNKSENTSSCENKSTKRHSRLSFWNTRHKRLHQRRTSSWKRNCHTRCDLLLLRT